MVVVHNGIIENYLTLKKKLREEGHKFSTETDTEVIAHLVEKYLTPSERPQAAAGRGGALRRAGTARRLRHGGDFQ